ncbi:MAG: pitrilysin family protein [Candidatus Neomarinimicrobiota bacterium]
MQIPYKKTVLNNGINILTRSVDSLRSAAVGIFIQAGSADESSKNNGIAHFLEHMSFKQTKTRNAYNIVEGIESKGGQINAYTSREMTAFFARVLDTEVNTALEVLCDIVQNSTYPKDEIERERSVVIEEIHDPLDSPQDVANDAFMKQMFPDHPYGYPIAGTIDTVSSFNFETIRDFVDENYTPDRISIVAVGAVDHDLIVKQIESLMGSIPASGKGGHNYPLFDPREKELVITRDITQTHMLIGRRAYSYSDERRIVYSILNAILSAGMTSRLFYNIREKYGFAYTIYSFIDAFKESGLFGVYVATDLKHVDTLQDLIWKEFNKLKNEGISKAELTKVKAQSMGSLLMGLESMSHQMQRMIHQHVHYGKIISIDETLKEVEAVSPEDIQKLAHELFDESLFHRLLLKPKRK